VSLLLGAELLVVVLGTLIVTELLDAVLEVTDAVPEVTDVVLEVIDAVPKVIDVVLEVTDDVPEVIDVLAVPAAVEEAPPAAAEAAKPKVLGVVSGNAEAAVRF
jgi:hypothetical protein